MVTGELTTQTPERTQLRETTLTEQTFLKEKGWAHQGMKEANRLLLAMNAPGTYDDSKPAAEQMSEIHEAASEQRHSGITSSLEIATSDAILSGFRNGTASMEKNLQEEERRHDEFRLVPEIIKLRQRRDQSPEEEKKVVMEIYDARKNSSPQKEMFIKVWDELNTRDLANQGSNRLKES